VAGIAATLLAIPLLLGAAAPIERFEFSQPHGAARVVEFETGEAGTSARGPHAVVVRELVMAPRGAP
jgi:hypothetical protein